MICDYEVRKPTGEVISRHKKFSAAATACLRLRRKGDLCDVYDAYWGGMIVPSGHIGLERWPSPYGDSVGIARDKPAFNGKPACLQKPYWESSHAT